MVEFAPDGCQPGCSGCNTGAEAVSALSEVVLEVFELFNEVVFPENIDLAKKEKENKPKITFDGESTYKTDEDTLYIRTNEYDNIEQTKEFLGFIGAMETNVKQNMPSELPSPSEIAFTLPLSKSSLFEMFSPEAEEKKQYSENERRDNDYEQAGTQNYGEHHDTSAKPIGERNSPLNSPNQSDAIDENVFVEESIDINKSDLTDEQSETELEGKYKAYIKNTLSPSEAEGMPCSQSGDEQSELLSIVESNDQDLHNLADGQDSDIESKEVHRLDKSKNPNKGVHAEAKSLDNIDHNEEDSSIELEDASATYSIGNMDSALEESVTCHSRDSALEESVTYHSKDSAFEESITYYSKDSAFEESVTYHSKDSAFEEGVTYHSKNSAFEESATEHSNSYGEEESYESDSHYDEDSYESVTGHSTSVRSTEVEANEVEASEIELSEEDKTTTEEHETSVAKDIAKPEDAKGNESPELCSLYDNLYPQDSLFSFLTKDESGSLFDFGESAHGPENERLKPPTSVVVQNKRADQKQDDGQMQDKNMVDEKLVEVEHDRENENETREERDVAVEEKKEENEECKPRVSEFASSGAKSKETIKISIRLDTLQTGESKAQVKERVSDSERSKTSQEDTKVAEKTERSTLKRNTRGRRKIPSRVKRFHQHRCNILKMQLKAE